MTDRLVIVPVVHAALHGDLSFAHVNHSVTCPAGPSGEDRNRCTTDGGHFTAASGCISAVGDGLGNFAAGDLHIVDITYPAIPVAVGSCDIVGGTRDVFVAEDHDFRTY